MGQKGLRFLHGPADGRAVGHVALQGDGARFPGQCFGSFPALTVEERRLPARLPESPHTGRADTPASPGDQRRFHTDAPAFCASAAAPGLGS